LQALLAFACIHEQAAKRRRLSASPLQGKAEHLTREEQFALDEVLQLVAERAVAITGADGVAIALAHGDSILCRASSGKIAPDPGIRLDPDSGFSGACLRSGQTVRCDDSETDDRVNAQACRGLGTRSMVAVPLAAKQRVIGLVEAFSTEAFGFNDADVRSLNLLGELILAAIRPEEEDRLAEMSKQIVVPDPAAAKSNTHPGVPQIENPSRIIVDEKFAPPGAATAKRDLSEEKTQAVKTDAPEAGMTMAPTVSTPVPSGVAAKAATAATLPKQETAPAVASRPAEQVAPDLPEKVEAQIAKVPATERERSLGGIALIAALVLIALGMGWAVYGKIRHAEQAISANTQPVVEEKTGKAETREIIPPAPAPVKSGATPQVTGIRHWASGNSSTVVVDLEDQVQYEAHSLDNPPRIYFDLHDTKIAPGLLNQSIDVNDALLKRVRMAQSNDGVTRVVLETKSLAEFSVSLEPNPYRLTIEVHNPSPMTVVKANPAATSKPTPEIVVSPKKEPTKQPVTRPSDMAIVLDAGHGGWDLGTVGKKGLLEKDLVLDIVQRLGALIESKIGARVIYTRQDDTYLPLEKRAEIANVARADLFLSVHANYSDLATARGVETYYTNTYSSIKARTDDSASLKTVDWTGVDIRSKVMDSRRFASSVQEALYGGIAERNPDIRNRGVKKAEYVVLTGTQMPAVLAEVSFVSSPSDEDKLQNSEYRQMIAESLYRGVAKYAEGRSRTKLASVTRQ
jgi:N-acetylmuramoyl-L-alanine amidase